VGPLLDQIAYFARLLAVAVFVLLFVAGILAIAAIFHVTDSTRAGMVGGSFAALGVIPTYLTRATGRRLTEGTKEPIR
jgi:hypothetical protein